MRRPVGVNRKFIFLASCVDHGHVCLQPRGVPLKIRTDLSPAFHPHSSLSIFARCQLGVSRFGGCCNLDVALWCSAQRTRSWRKSRSHPNSAIFFGMPTYQNGLSCASN